MGHEHTRSLSPCLAGLCLIGALLMKGLSAQFGFRTQTLDPWAVLTLVSLCIVLRLPPILHRHPRITSTFETFLAIVVILDFTLTFPWQVQAYAFPLVDAQIRSFDISLGFDHVLWMNWLNSHVEVTMLLAFAYKSMIPQTGIVLLLQVITGRIGQTDRYLCAFIISIFLTSVVSVFLPTRGIVAILDPALRGTPAWPFGATDVATYDALRSGALRDLFGVPTLGIVSFPSFHASSAVLATWAFWSFRIIRYPAVVLNVALSIATVGCGGHYIADVLAGYIIAIVAILLAQCGSSYSYAGIDRLKCRMRNIIIPRMGSRVS